jgi:hypothetical protein
MTEHGRAICRQSGDPLTSDHSHDAFDVYRLLNHQGDFPFAVEAAAKILGIGDESQ